MAKKAKGKQKQEEKPQSSNPVSPTLEPVRAVVEPGFFLITVKLPH